MKDFNINDTIIPRKVGYGIIAAIVIFALLGYILYFSAKSSFSATQKEFESMKDKLAHAEENLAKNKKQIELSEEEFKQLTKEHESLTLKQHECKMELEETQSKS